MIWHIAMFGVLLIALFEDLREQKIHIFPVMLMMTVGGIVQLFVVHENWLIMAKGCIPGILSWVIGKLCRECIGKGDSLLVLCVGVLNGHTFCLRFVLVSCICIFLFSSIMMLLGKLHRKSKVPCVPFMVIGYLGAWLL